ncbi:MAG: glycoside hydrolase family 99-like domain-containing protein [Terricaulis sp.]
MADDAVTNSENSPQSRRSSARSRRRIVVVLGMHRSGTSVITRGLQVLGVSLGDHLMQASGDNSKGFFEDLDIYHLNEKLLAKIGSTWNNLAPIDGDALAGPAFSQERREAAALLSAKISGAEVFAFKDPRTALLMPFWRCVFDDLDLDDRYLIALRNPLEVAASLQARDHMPLAKGVMLWAKHMIEAIRHTDGKPRVLVNFDDVLDAPEDELARIAVALDLPAQLDVAAMASFRGEFLATELRHHRIGKNELRRSGVAAAFMIELFECLLRAESLDQLPPTQWSALVGRYEDAAPLLVYADQLDTAQTEATKRADAAEKTAARLADVDAALATSDAARQELDARAAALQQERDHLAAEASRQQQTNANLTRENATLKQRVTMAEASSAQNARELSGLRGELEAQAALTKQREADLASLRATSTREIEGLTQQLTDAKHAELRTAAELTRARSAAATDAAALDVKLAKERAQADALLSAAQAARTQAETRAETAVRERDTKRSELLAAHARLGDHAAALEKRTQEVEHLRAMLVAKEDERRRYRRDMLVARAGLTATTQSLSWRITAPLRGALRVARDPGRSVRVAGAMVARKAWRAIPLPPEQRGRLAGKVFQATPGLFAWSGAYKRWHASQQAAPVAAIAQAESVAAPITAPEVAPPPRPPQLETYVPLLAHTPPSEVAARAIAFYLPQFHRIAENDAWWGEGFTEWTKVRPSAPRYPGHYQPHEPDALGYYDLVETPGIMAKQAELAKLHGLSGFCFYFYWFAGKRLLEAPLQNLLHDSSVDLPFCLCWANENWTRRWDGKSQEILIAQNHSEDDDLAFIAHVSQYFADPRYIRINGRPLLLVYRPALLPNAKETSLRWRRWLRENGHGDVYLAYTQSFENAPPETYGFDAAVEFPPNNKGLAQEPMPAAAFSSDTALHCYDWRKLVSESRDYQAPAYRLFRGANPSWDNTPRRPRDGAVLLNASPDAYEEWLGHAVRDTARRFDNPEERLVFINAWNEWAEGAHLEPDKRYGYAWLEATRRALSHGADRPHVLVVAHDLYRHGAQFLALSIADTLREKFGCAVTMIAGKDGPLADTARQRGPLHILDPALMSAAEIDAAVEALAAQGFRHAVVNSAASAWLSPVFAKHGIAHVGLVHEMAQTIEVRDLGEALRVLDTNARAVVFPAQVVRESARTAAGLTRWRAPVIRPQGLYKTACVADLSDKERARTRLAQRFGVSADARFVVALAYADARKGPDIFADWAGAAAARWRDLHFVWVGDIDPAFKAAFDAHIAAARARGAQIHVLPFQDDVADFYLGASLFALTSREDPFPSVALEALAAATPVIMKAGAGGIEELGAFGCVDAIDETPGAFTTAAAKWLDDDAAHRQAGIAGRDLVREHFGAISYVGAVADLLELETPNISVVAPNYNYAHCLEQRLQSILAQTLAPREIIVLDDASTDDSIAVVERVLAQSRINWRIVRNQENSGSVFAQWRKGAELAQGEFVWIAEADDWADPRFLETAALPMRRGDVVLSATQSKQADVAGNVIAADYLDYVRDVSPDKWTRAFYGDGEDEVRGAFSVKNTLPNVSAVLFRRAALVETLTRHYREITSYRVAGDWCVYVNLLRHGGMAFAPAALNYHRRHDSSVTIAKFGLKELAEIARMQAFVAKEFGVDDTRARQARAYLDVLVAQFGLAEKCPPAQLEGALRGIAAA